MQGSSFSIDAALTILKFLEQAEKSCSVRKIAAKTGIAKSTVHRILKHLSSMGWAYQDSQDRNYYVGLKLLALANEWRLNLDLVKQMDPVLREISYRSGQTAFVNIIDRDKAVCLHKIEPSNPVRVASVIGREQAFHAGASGKLLLAYAPEWLVEKVLLQPLKAFTPYTITDIEILRKQLHEIRRKGYCTSVEEVDPGVGAVSVPLVNKTQNIVLAVTIAGTRFDFERDHEKWLSILFEITKGIQPVLF